MQVPYIVGFQAQDAGLVIKVEIGDEIYLQTGYTVYRLACRISYPFLGKKNWFYAFMKIHITRVLDLDLTLQKSGSSWSGSDSKSNLMNTRVLVTHMSSKAETESDPSKNHISFHISEFFFQKPDPDLTKIFESESLLLTLRSIFWMTQWTPPVTQHFAYQMDFYQSSTVIFIPVASLGEKSELYQRLIIDSILIKEYNTPDRKKIAFYYKLTLVHTASK